MKRDSLGDRMKSQYEDRTRIFLPRRTYTIIRGDGKAFHTFTRGCKKPYDKELMDTMDEVAQALCEQIQGACLAYVQSDEISILLTDFTKPGTNAWFDGNVQKMASISAAIATGAFNMNYYLGDSLPNMNHYAMFDSRVFTIPDPVEVENYFVWRQQDASRNSVQMAARAVFSHKECENKSCDDLQDMLHSKGINWNDHSSREKRGGVIMKEEYDWTGKDRQSNPIEVKRNRWSPAKEIPIFTQDRSFLKNLIPRITEANFGLESTP